ncbi:hypothetical protein AeMF1_019516 [Aphanomyces euteiches]|nr:hypothetical protein AeMF1_019516 [Aphanomyces euteiches]
MDLWKVQYELDQTDRVPIRPAAVKELLKLKQMAMVDEENSTFKDHGIGTMVDSVDQTSLREVADKFFSEMTEVGLKHRADNLMTYALATRGDNIRRLKLSNIDLIVFENEGFGNVEESTFMRHKDVTRCPFGALGLYFLFRWRIGGEPCPDLSDPELCYDIYALKGSNPKTPMKYSHQYQAIKKQHESLGLRSTSKTKAGRKSAAVTAEHEGASGHSVDKHGHWATRTRDGSYANHVVPWETVRTLAGAEKGRYYVERAMVAVPKDLQCMVFPWIESARVAMNLKRRDIAGESFLRLMEYMRVVILQDAALLIRIPGYNQHPVYQMPVFTNSAFISFQQQLIVAVETAVAPEFMAIEKAMPLVAESLQNVRQDTALIYRELSQVTLGPRKVQEVVENMASKCCDNTNLVRQQVVGALQQAIDGLAAAPSNQQFTNDCSAVVTQSTHLVAPSPKSIVRSQTMSRSIDTVRLAWKEYQVGLNGAPALKDLELQHGAKWRSTDVERKFFQRRKPLYTAIEQLMAEGMEEACAVSLLEELLNNLKRNKHVKHMRGYCDFIKCKINAVSSSGTTLKSILDISCDPVV